jgi:hypothetical protein
MMTQRPIRRRLTRPQRLLRGLRQINKYAVGSALAALIGCVPPNNAMKISPDGRYLVLPYTEDGVGIGEKPARVVVIDLENNSASLAHAQLQGTFLWFDRAGDTTCFMKSESADGRTTSSVIVIHGLDKRVIENAMFPSLSSDGRMLAAVTSAEGEQRLMVHDVANNKTTILDVQADLADMSPDGKHIVCIRGDLNEPHDKTFEIHVVDSDGRNDRRLTTMNPNTESLFDPQWIDNQRIMFVDRRPEHGDDEEVFTIDLEGTVNVITSNDLDDRYPQFIGEGRFL